MLQVPGASRSLRGGARFGLGSILFMQGWDAESLGAQRLARQSTMCEEEVMQR